jgi:hypothetical protein
MRLQVAAGAIQATFPALFLTLLVVSSPAPSIAWQCPADTDTPRPLHTVLAIPKLSDEVVEEEVPAVPAPDNRESAGPDASNPPRTRSPEERERQTALDRCLAIYYTRQVDAEVLRPWSIMHGLIGYGEETLIIYRGRRYSATEYLCANGIGDDRRILYLDNGRIGTRTGPGVQGHEGQLLAMLAQANVPADQSLTVEGQSFTVHDLIETEMQTCRSDAELTFKLLALSHYLDCGTAWTNRAGESWDLTRVLREELAQPVNDGACGGTHRLMALSFALARRQEEGLPIEGDWWRARKFIDEFQDYAWYFQGRDGSFSTGWFEEKQFSGDVERKLYTTGHILEWLVFSLPETELQDPRVIRSVDYLLNLMLTAPNYDLPVGPRGHALHALRMYQEKVFGKSDYRRFMNNRQLVSNNPQNAGGGSSSQSADSESPRLFPAGIRRGLFGRR